MLSRPNLSAKIPGMTAEEWRAIVDEDGYGASPWLMPLETAKLDR